MVTDRPRQVPPLALGGSEGKSRLQSATKKPSSTLTRSTSSASRSGSRATWDNLGSEEAPRVTTASSKMAATAPAGWSGLVAASATAPTASPVRAARAAAKAVAAVQPAVARSSTFAWSGPSFNPKPERHRASVSSGVRRGPGTEVEVLGSS